MKEGSFGVSSFGTSRAIQSHISSLNLLPIECSIDVEDFQLPDLDNYVLSSANVLEDGTISYEQPPELAQLKDYDNSNFDEDQETDEFFLNESPTQTRITKETKSQTSKLIEHDKTGFFNRSHQTTSNPVSSPKQTSYKPSDSSNKPNAGHQSRSSILPLFKDSPFGRRSPLVISQPQSHYAHSCSKTHVSGTNFNRQKQEPQTPQHFVSRSPLQESQLEPIPLKFDEGIESVNIPSASRIRKPDSRSTPCSAAPGIRFPDSLSLTYATPTSSKSAMMAPPKTLEKESEKKRDIPSNSNAMEAVRTNNIYHPPSISSNSSLILGLSCNMKRNSVILDNPPSPYPRLSKTAVHPASFYAQNIETKLRQSIPSHYDHRSVHKPSAMQEGMFHTPHSKIELKLRPKTISKVEYRAATTTRPGTSTAKRNKTASRLLTTPISPKLRTAARMRLCQCNMHHHHHDPSEHHSPSKMKRGAATTVGKTITTIRRRPSPSKPASKIYSNVGQSIATPIGKKKAVASSIKKNGASSFKSTCQKASQTHSASPNRKNPMLNPTTSLPEFKQPLHNIVQIPSPSREQTTAILKTPLPPPRHTPVRLRTFEESIGPNLSFVKERLSSQPLRPFE